MTVMPNAPEVSSPPSVESTTRFGARAVLAAVALALVAVPGALILPLLEDKWAPLLRADDGAHLSATSSRIRAPGTATRASATAASTARAPNRVVDLTDGAEDTSGALGMTVILPPSWRPIHPPQ